MITKKNMWKKYRAFELRTLTELLICPAVQEISLKYKLRLNKNNVID